MCFSRIFPCLSCDEGQVAQIENQEVSKKFISKNLHCDTEKLKWKAQDCVTKCLINS